MKAHTILWLLILTTAANHAWAYGTSSSSKKACAKPKFSEFSPINNAQVAPSSAFSFRVYAQVNPESIHVTVKDQPVTVTITPENQWFNVSGKLPDTLKATYARISIAAEGANQCKGSDDWLVKITE